MARFKDGAFRLAIEKQVPIVPVTIPYNWIILPDDGKLLLHWHRNMVIFHDPIETSSLQMEDMEQLKKQVYEIIDSELQRRNDLDAAAAPAINEMKEKLG
jgi:1-acyl-sn-glycerol-3-phosphate acyltransferase